MLGENPADFWREVLKGIITGVSAGLVLYFLQRKTALRKFR